MAHAYITTPIYYINAEPHLGHTYTTVVADTLARFHREQGDATFFITGTDEHGEKIAQAAAANNVDPRTHADRISRVFRETWDACGISYDHFIRTTDPYHIAVVQEILQRVYDAGDIYFGSYSGLYCTGCERFYSEKELVDGLCPDHRTPPTALQEENYFFRMSRYQAAWLDHLEKHPEMIVPERYRNEVLAMLRGDELGDLCISRPKSRLTWGIELPFDRNFVTYVWFDALINYVSGLRHRRPQEFDAFWPTAQHLIGKDILKPHGVFWPTMLMAAGLPLFRRLCVHGFWIRGESKMSKSLGNVIRPLEMKERFGMDAFRYFLLREMAFGQDAVFSEDAFVTRINADLSNNLGNLVSRTLSMQQRYFQGVVQELGELAEEDRALVAAFHAAREQMPSLIADLAFHKALEVLWRAIDQANKYVVETAPFRLAREEHSRPRAGAILHHLLEALALTSVLLRPFMPETAARMLRLLALPEDWSPGQAWQWGRSLPAGHVTRAPEILFPRIEVAGPDQA